MIKLVAALAMLLIAMIILSFGTVFSVGGSHPFSEGPMGILWYEIYVPTLFVFMLLGYVASRFTQYISFTSVFIVAGFSITELGLVFLVLNSG